MDVKPGFKRTQIGILPTDWDVTPIDRLATSVRGGSPRPAGDPRYFDGSFIPWLTVAALTNIPSSQLVVSETATCLTEEGSLRSRTLLPGTLIIANSGATLGVAKLLGFKCCANDGIAALLNVDPDVSSVYLAHYINSKTDYLRSVVATGNGQPNLNTGLIGSFTVPLPPRKGEQEAIAKALSDTDALIESLEQLIAKKRQIKHGATLELLTGKKRLPGFVGDWQTKCLSEVCWFQEGPGVRNYQFTSSGIKLLNGTNIYRGSLNLDSTSRYISPKEAYGPYAHFMAEAGDIVIASSGITIERFHEKVAFVKQSDLPFCMNTSTIRFKPFASSLISAFLYQYLTSDGFKAAIGGQATGSAQLNFGPSHVAKVVLSLPSVPEQSAIADVLRSMDEDIAAQESKLTKAYDIKQAMMQELLTGRIRLV